MIVYCKLFGFVLLTTLFAVGCQQDDEPTTVTEPTRTATKNYAGVNRELWVYFQRFEEEATKRGVKVDLVAARVTGVIEEISEDDVLGQCNFNPRQPNHLLIDKTFWAAASDRFREFVVFHELGHCSLFRDHREDVLPTGACASIMRSGKEDCRDNYNSTTRNNYLDELYNTVFYGDIFK